MTKRPKFCPQCSAELKGSLANVELIDADGKTSWDTYCKNCGWSGIISTDIEEVQVL